MDFWFFKGFPIMRHLKLHRNEGNLTWKCSLSKDKDFNLCLMFITLHTEAPSPAKEIHMVMHV